MMVPMASLTLKKLSDDLLQALRDAAENNRRSLTQEVVHLLETALGRRPKTPVRPDVEAQMIAWRKLAGKWESDVDPTTEAKRITEKRTSGREVDL
jgi:plasmid stability protein